MLLNISKKKNSNSVAFISHLNQINLLLQMICLLKKRVVISTFVPLPINPTTTLCRFILVTPYGSTKYVRARPFSQPLGK